MSIVNMVKTVKEVHDQDIVFVKIGKFYHAYGKDSYIIAYLFNYKLKSIENVSACGFSENCINKVKSKIEDLKINYLILDRKNNYEVDERTNNKNLNTYDKIFEKAKLYITYKSRIDKIHEFMLENLDKENFKETLKKMEEILNERRKV